MEGRLARATLVAALLLAACGGDDGPTRTGAPATEPPGTPVDGVTALDGHRVEISTSSLAAVPGARGPGVALADGIALADGVRRLRVTTIVDGRQVVTTDAAHPALLWARASWDPPRLLVSGTSCPALPAELPEMWDEVPEEELCGPDAPTVIRTLDLRTRAWDELPLPVDDVRPGYSDVSALGDGTALVTWRQGEQIETLLVDTGSWDEIPVEASFGLLGTRPCPHPDGGSVLSTDQGAWLLREGGVTPVEGLHGHHCDGAGGLLADLAPGRQVPATVARGRVAADGTVTVDEVPLPPAALDPDAWTVELAGTPGGAILYVGHRDGPPLRPWLLEPDGTWRQLSESTTGPDVLHEPLVVDGAAVGFGGRGVVVLS